MSATIHGFGKALLNGACENTGSKIIGNPRLILWIADEALSWGKHCKCPKQIGPVNVVPVRDVILSSESFLEGPFDLAKYGTQTADSVLSFFRKTKDTSKKKAVNLAQNTFGTVATGAKTALFLHKYNACKLAENHITPLKVTACSASIAKSAINIGEQVLMKNPDEKKTKNVTVLSARVGKKILEVARSITSIVFQSLCIVKHIGSVTLPRVVYPILTSSMLVMTLAVEVLNTSDKPAKA